MTAEPTSSKRIAAVDLGRGVALVAMTVFHFCWDLAMFRVIDPATMFEPGMVWFARSIAGSFLFLVGFSLVLAHGSGLRWRSFAIRLAQVTAAAGLITVATYFATPEAFIFFGILHSIALASVLALPLLFAPWWAAAAVGAFVLFAKPFLRTEALDAPIWWWTGLSEVVPVSNDYVPVFPFFGMVALGVAAGLLARQRQWLALLARPDFSGGPSRLLRFIGRNSLAYYLAHQPVMIALLGAWFWISARI